MHPMDQITQNVRKTTNARMQDLIDARDAARRLQLLLEQADFNVRNLEKLAAYTRGA